MVFKHPVTSSKSVRRLRAVVVSLVCGVLLNGGVPLCPVHAEDINSAIDSVTVDGAVGSSPSRVEGAAERESLQEYERRIRRILQGEVDPSVHPVTAVPAPLV